MAEETVKLLKVSDFPSVRSHKHVTIYADQVRITPTTYDFRIVFSMVIEPRPHKPVSEELVTVIITPQHAKELLRVLTKQVGVWTKETKG